MTQHLNDFDFDRSGFDSSRMDIMATFFGLEMERQLSRQMYEHSLDVQAVEAKFERLLKEEKDRIAADKDDQRIKELEAAENLWEKTLNEEKVKAAGYKKESKRLRREVIHLQNCLGEQEHELKVALDDLENLKEDMCSLQVKVSKDKEHQAELEAKTDNERKIIQNNLIVPAARRPDIKILVMGPTGTGKSSFIRLITGDPNIKVGNGVEPETSEIRCAHYFEADGRCITFVDTPPFVDAHRYPTDKMTLKMIAAFLEADYKNGKKLNGIIYMYRITELCLTQPISENLEIFSEICGPKSFKNVAVVTTCWDQVRETKEAFRRERELMTDRMIFHPFYVLGARFLRHHNSSESARQIMEQFLECDPVTLQIQNEMAEGKTLEETTANKALMTRSSHGMWKITPAPVCVGRMQGFGLDWAVIGPLNGRGNNERAGELRIGTLDGGNNNEWAGKIEIGVLGGGDNNERAGKIRIGRLDEGNNNESAGI